MQQTQTLGHTGQLTGIEWRLYCLQCSHLNMAEPHHILTRLQQLHDPNLSLQVLTDFGVLFEVALTHSLDRYLLLAVLGEGRGGPALTVPPTSMSTSYHSLHARADTCNKAYNLGHA